MIVRSNRLVARAASLIALASTGTACGGEDDRLVVLAASSLAEAFDVIEAEFEAAHDGVDVVIGFDGSSRLAAQIEQGAPVDVFASADGATMARVRDRAAEEPVVFARNVVVIAVEAGNPLGIDDLADLADRDLTVVLAAPEVPAGAYSRRALELAGVEVLPDSYEQSVRAVASKVAIGEADAGLVYRTDVAANADRLDAVAIDDDALVRADYPIAAMSDDPLARAFVELVLGAAGQRVLTEHGFESP